MRAVIFLSSAQSSSGTSAVMAATVFTARMMAGHSKARTPSRTPVARKSGTLTKYCHTLPSRPAAANSSRRMASASRSASKMCIRDRFCRDREFAAERVSGTHARFETASDAGTRAVYPFDFRLRVDFSLEGATIVKTHTVENTGEAPMPFELGGHEAYATRLLPGEHMADYFARFEGADALEMFGMDGEGILALPKIEVPLEAGRLTKTPEQLGIDTIVLELSLIHIS